MPQKSKLGFLQKGSIEYFQSIGAPLRSGAIFGASLQSMERSRSDAPIFKPERLLERRSEKFWSANAPNVYKNEVKLAIFLH